MTRDFSCVFLITLTAGCRTFSFNQIVACRKVPHDENTAYILVYVHRGGLYLFGECDKIHRRLITRVAIQLHAQQQQNKEKNKINTFKTFRIKSNRK